MMKAKVRQKMDKPLAEKPCLTLEREHGGSLGLARRPDRVLVAPFEYGGRSSRTCSGHFARWGLEGWYRSDSRAARSKD
jgi:hypothetical protein